MQNICVVIYHDKHEACKHNSEQLALLSALKALMSFRICGKPQIFLLQHNICCLLPMEFLSRNQVQLYHVLFLPLNKVFFFEFFSIKCSQVHILKYLEVLPLPKTRPVDFSFSYYYLRISHPCLC